MKLFYAYLKDANHKLYYRHLITFVNRETADEWWRMVSTSPSPYIGNVKRISPQFYTHSAYTTIDLPNTFFNRNELPDAMKFFERMFFTRINDGDDKIPTTIPPIEVTDHISDRWYFIRSKADSWSHWYFRTDGACLVCGDANCDAIHVSSEYRTKFCVRVRPRDDFQVPEDFVMIGKDEISIIAPTDYTLHINDARDLKATTGYQGEIDLLFNDLKNRFITRAEKQVNGEIWEYVVPVQRGLGEVWELVD